MDTGIKINQCEGYYELTAPAGTETYTLNAYHTNSNYGYEPVETSVGEFLVIRSEECPSLVAMI